MEIVFTIGVGLTVTITSKVNPAQEPETGVTVYTTFIGALVLLVNVPEIADSFVPDWAPVIPVTIGADQEYVVPDGTRSVPFVGVMENDPPEHIVRDLFCTTGFGLTVIVNVVEGPGQAFAVGVTVIVDVITALVVFATVNVFISPVPDAPIPIAVLLLVQVNIVPLTDPLKAMLAN